MFPLAAEFHTRTLDHIRKFQILLRHLEISRRVYKLNLHWHVRILSKRKHISSFSFFQNKCQILWRTLEEVKTKKDSSDSLCITVCTVTCVLCPYEQMISFTWRLHVNNGSELGLKGVRWGCGVEERSAEHWAAIRPAPCLKPWTRTIFCPFVS